MDKTKSLAPSRRLSAEIGQKVAIFEGDGGEGGAEQPELSKAKKRLSTTIQEKQEPFIDAEILEKDRLMAAKLGKPIEEIVQKRIALEIQLGLRPAPSATNGASNGSGEAAAAKKKKAEEEAAKKKKAEEEAAKKKKAEEEAAKKKKAEEEAAKKKKAEEEAAKKKKAEEDARRKKAEEELKRRQAEEAARKKREADDKAWAQERLRLEQEVKEREKRVKEEEKKQMQERLKRRQSEFEWQDMAAANAPPAAEAGSKKSKKKAKKSETESAAPATQEAPAKYGVGTPNLYSQLKGVQETTPAAVGKKTQKQAPSSASSSSKSSSNKSTKNFQRRPQVVKQIDPSNPFDTAQPNATPFVVAAGLLVVLAVFAIIQAS